MADTYKLEENLPCQLCVKEGRDKPYKMTRFLIKILQKNCKLLILLVLSTRATFLIHVGAKHGRVLLLLDEEVKKQLVGVIIIAIHHNHNIMFDIMAVVLVMVEYQNSNLPRSASYLP